ncbi:pheST operon leader peptide PheM [Providencia stuartii]
MQIVAFRFFFCFST